MAKENHPAEPTRAQPTPGDFPVLLEGFARFMRAYCDAALEATSDEPEIRPTLLVLHASATSAADETAAELRRIYDQTSMATRANVEKQLRLSGGLPLVRAANDAITSPGANTRSVLGWLCEIIHLLKKLISLLFPHIPRWLLILLDFIDEVIQMIQHLLGAREASRFSQEMAERWLTSLRLINLVEASDVSTTAASQDEV
jgi:hypothetical protein